MLSDKMMDHLLVLLFVSSVTAVFLGGCASVAYSTKSLPFRYHADNKTALRPEPFDPFLTPIGSAYRDEFSADPSLSGAMPITRGSYALMYRVALVRMATRAIEIQTYIYENDLTGRILMQELKKAADRGVIVRILVDDNGLDSDFSDIMTLDYHPNVEVKVFNPFKYRSRVLRYPQMILHVSRLNHRMHNKLFIADDFAVITGGRNIAGNYFDAGETVNFSDTDALFIGKIAREARNSFDEYWNYDKSIPVAAFPGRDDPTLLEKAYEETENLKNVNPETAERYERVISDFIAGYENKKYPIHWGKGAIIADSPSKTEGKNETSPIIRALRHLWKNGGSSIYISSAYLVPGKKGTEDILDAVENGTEVKILTNSLSSTDAAVAYAGWFKYRNELVDNGVKIYEFKKEGYKIKNKMSLGASLHSKVMIFGDNVTWVGSFNLDPRSAAVNTEVVAAFYGDSFANEVRNNIEENMSPEFSWRLTCENGAVVWTGERNGAEATLLHSPDTSSGARFLMLLMTLVPESLL